MGSTLDSSTVIEFCGLPGTGKSTVSHILAQRLRECGQNVIEPSYDLDHKSSPFVRIARKTFKAGSYAIFDLDFLKVGIKLLKTQPVKSSIKLVTNYYYLKNFIINSQIDKPLIFDQGLVQSIWSLLYGNESISTFVLEFCSKKLNWGGRKAYIVYLYAPHNTVTSRIKKRTNDGSRLGKEIENRKLDLAIYEDIFERIFSSIGKSNSPKSIEILKIENENGDPVNCVNNILDCLV